MENVENGTCTGQSGADPSLHRSKTMTLHDYTFLIAELSLRITNMMTCLTCCGSKALLDRPLDYIRRKIPQADMEKFLLFLSKETGKSAESLDAPWRCVMFGDVKEALEKTFIDRWNPAPSQEVRYPNSVKGSGAPWFSWYTDLIIAFSRGLGHVDVCVLCYGSAAVKNRPYRFLWEQMDHKRFESLIKRAPYSHNRDDEIGALDAQCVHLKHVLEVIAETYEPGWKQ
jgi:hypothetical protein